MDSELLIILPLLIALIVIEWLIAIVCGVFASTIGVTGIVWWAVAIVLFLLINALIGALNRVGNPPY